MKIVTMIACCACLAGAAQAETQLKEGKFKIGLEVPPRTNVKSLNNRLVISQDGSRNVVFAPKTGANFSEPVKNSTLPVRVHQMRRGGRTVGVAITH